MRTVSASRNRHSLASHRSCYSPGRALRDGPGPGPDRHARDRAGAELVRGAEAPRTGEMTVSGNVDLCLAEAQLRAKNEILKKVVSEFAVMEGTIRFLIG